MAKHRTGMMNRDLVQVKTTVHEGVFLEGVLQFDSSVKICGQFKGKIHSSGYLYIDETAEITGELAAGSVVISGYVKGTIIAKDSVEMLPSGKIFGDVKASKLKIADGVIFEGKCEMDAPDKD
jgi:cytoskeletal protein CcmA (bactofilin family)